MKSLAVSEVFGPTIQGEGPAAGRPCAFVRTAGCNLRCTWCDTAYTWDFDRFDREAEVTMLAPDIVARELCRHLPLTSPALVVVSGGEPMLQQPALAEVFAIIRQTVEVHVETAGTLPPGPLDAFVTHYVVSLKLAHSLNAPRMRLRETAIQALNETGRVSWKFVARDRLDVEEAARIVARYALRGEVYIMPEGTSHETLTKHGRAIMDAVIAHGFRYTPRLHVELWGTERRR